MENTSEKKMPIKEIKYELEEAIEKAGFGLYNIFLTILSCLLILSMGMESYSIAIVLVASACELESTPEQQSYLAAAPMIGSLFCANIWGYLGDTRGRKKTLMWSLTSGYVFGMTSTFSVNWIMLFVLKVLSAGSLSGVLSLSLSLLNESTPQQKRDSTSMTVTSVMLLITSVQAAIAIPILPLQFSYHIDSLGICFNSWRLLCIAFSSPLFICLLVMQFTYESPKFLLSRGDEAGALNSLKLIHKFNMGSEAQYEVTALKMDEENGTKDLSRWQSLKNQTLPLFQAPLLKYTLLIGGLNILIYLSSNTLMLWLTTMISKLTNSMRHHGYHQTESFCDIYTKPLNHTHQHFDKKIHCHVNTETLSFIALALAVVALVNLIMSLNVTRIGRKNMLMGILSITAVSAILINHVGDIYVSMVLIIIYLCNATGMGAVMMYAVMLYPTYLRAIALTLFMVLGRGSVVMGVQGLGYIIRTDCHFTFYVFSAISGVALLFAFFLPSDKPKTTEETLAVTPNKEEDLEKKVKL